MAEETTTPVTAAEPAAIAAPQTSAAVAPIETRIVVAAEPAKPSTILGEEPVAPAVEPVAPAEVPKVEPAAEPAKPVEGEPVPAEVKKEDGSQPAEPAPLPTYETFTLPEGMNFKDEQLNEFTKMLGDFEVKNKADHAETQKFGQALVDRHVSEVKAAIDGIHETYKNTWENQTIKWRDDFEKDPEIGGNRKDTTVKAAQEFISTHGGTSVQQAEFRNLMETTGIGNHPAMIRLLAKANSAMREGAPLAGRVSAQKVSKVQAMYGGKKS